MITRSALARLLQDQYDGKLPITWTGGHDGQSFQVSLVQLEGEDLALSRGSRTPLEWAADFLAALAVDRTVREHQALGVVDLGFLLAVQSVYDYVRAAALAAAAAKRAFTLGGHSLGGVMALGQGALLRSEGIPVTRVVSLAAPRFGGKRYAAMLAGTDVFEARYGEDFVPNLPPWLKHAHVPLQFASPFRSLLDYHHLPNYIAALDALETSAPIAA